MQAKKIILSPMQKILGEDFNPGLLMIISRKSLIWCILIVLLTTSSSILYLRYTTPLYEVLAQIMIKQENTSSSLGISSDLNSGNQMDQLELQKNIQIMKSNVILERVIEKLPLSISYFNVGQVLLEERYKTSPFEINASVISSNIYDIPIYFIFLSYRDYKIEYKISKTKYSFVGKFKQKCITPHFNFVAKMTNEISNKIPDIYLNSKYYFTINSKDNLLKGLRGKIRIELYPPTIQFSLQDAVPQKAADIVNTLNDEFIKYNKEKKTESSSLIVDFINTQIDLLSAELQAYENQLKAFKIEHSLISTDSKANEILSALKKVNDDQINLIADEKNLNYYLEYFNLNKDSSKLQIGIVDPKYAGLQGYVLALDKLQSEKQEKLLKLQPANPQILILNKQIAEVKSNIIQNIINSKTNIKQEKEELIDSYNKYLKEFQEFPDLEAEFEKLNNLSSLKEKYYLMFLDKKSSFTISLAGYVSDFVILKRADITKNPVFPNVPLIKSIGVLLGIFLSILFIFIRYLLSNKILSISEIDRFCNAGIIGVIPIYKKPMDVSQLVVNMNPKSVISESFRSIRTNLDYVYSGIGSKIISVTSTIGGEGKTFISVNIVELKKKL